MEIDDLLKTAFATKIAYEDTLVRFESEDTSVYGDRMDRWLPDFEYVHDLIAQAVAPYVSEAGKIIDLGGGTGHTQKLPCDAVGLLRKHARFRSEKAGKIHGSL